MKKANCGGMVPSTSSHYYSTRNQPILYLFGMPNDTKYPCNLVYEVAAKAIKLPAQDIHLLAGTILFCTTLPRGTPPPIADQKLHSETLR